MTDYERLLKYFKYEHLPKHLQSVSEDFSVLAHKMVRRNGEYSETIAGLRKLLEAKDCAVRALI